MDIQIRKQLEQLEYIKDKLEYIEYDEALGCYIEKQDGLPTGVAAWVNGAFYGFEQAAKAQAVPAEFEIGQLKDRITELLDERQDLYAQIEAQAVPDGYCVVPREPTPKMSIAYQKNAIAPVSSLSISGYKAMIEAQEPAND